MASLNQRLARLNLGPQDQIKPPSQHHASPQAPPSFPGTLAPEASQSHSGANVLASTSTLEDVIKRQILELSHSPPSANTPLSAPSDPSDPAFLSYASPLEVLLDSLQDLLLQRMQHLVSIAPKMHLLHFFEDMVKGEIVGMMDSVGMRAGEVRGEIERALWRGWEGKGWVDVAGGGQGSAGGGQGSAGKEGDKMGVSA